MFPLYLTKIFVFSLWALLGNLQIKIKNIKIHARDLNYHFTRMWMLFPIRSIVSWLYWHFVYSLEVNDVDAQVAGASESFMQLKWAVMSVFVNTCSLLPLQTATLHGTARAPSNQAQYSRGKH